MKGRFARKLFAFTLALAMLTFTIGFSCGNEAITEYERYVHYNSQDGINRANIDKPVFPVKIFNASIPIGENLTITCPLQADHTYHVYIYGDWVHTGPEPKTDYDIYVYSPEGTMESSHTEAAGFPEHLGTTVDSPFFIPKKTGNYTFMLINDARESSGAEAATFMIIENIECDTWYTFKDTGKSGSEANFYTNWAYEFVTDSSLIEVYVKVPDSLDMYEARLYLMSNAQSVTINNVSLPWEPGLYGNGTGVGGYNMESDAYRGVAYASCEFSGQDMYLNYTTADTARNVYHLVLMGEVGEGTIDFLVKTSFGGGLSPLTRPSRVTPDDETRIAYFANSTQLENATLQYTIDDWKSTAQLGMLCDNRTCNTTIPKQPAGSTVKYKINAVDVLKNLLSAEGQFIVKQNSEIIGFNVTKNPITLGTNLTITGAVSQHAAGKPLELQFITASDTQYVECESYDNGTFKANFQPTVSGIWTVQAFFKGNDKVYESESAIILVTVNEPTFIQKNGVFIFAGIIGVLAAVGAVYYIRKRRSG